MPLKPFLTVEQQIEHLNAIGIRTERSLEVTERLAAGNYYRLRAYWMTFEREGDVIPGTTFDQVWRTYRFDSELRRWLWTSLEPIEIKLRSQLAYHLAENCGPQAYLDARHFSNKNQHTHLVASFERELSRAIKNQEPCACHNMEKYGVLPIWAAVEIMTMGQVSSLYGLLTNDQRTDPGATATVGDVARAFGLRSSIIKSWAQHLCGVRNVCGHHNRFYNRIMRIRPKLLARDAKWASNKEFPTFLVLKRIYEVSWPAEWTKLVRELGEIVEAYRDVSLEPMGFPENWRRVLGVGIGERIGDPA